MTICPAGAEFCADGQTDTLADGQTDTLADESNIRFSQFLQTRLKTSNLCVGVIDVTLVQLVP
jgi:hypothetical protein